MDYYQDIQPIHELPSDELEDLLSHALEHSEFLWTHKPGPGESFKGICHEADFDFLTVIHSIKKSLSYFYPDHKEDLSALADASGALFYSDSMAHSLPMLQDGLRATAKLFLHMGPCYCEPEGRDAALENFGDMERAVFKYAESARHYYHDAVMKEVKPLVTEGQKRRKQLTAPRQKKNRYVLKHCLELMERKPSKSAPHLFNRFPNGEANAIEIDGTRIFREVTEDGEEKIVCVKPDGTRMASIGTRAFQKYFNEVKK